MKTYYEILGIADNAKYEDIEIAYRSVSEKIKKLYEFSDEIPKNILSKIEEAYMVLGDSKIRKSYDQWLFYKNAGGEESFKNFAGLKVKTPKFNNSKSNIGNSLLKHCLVGAIYLAFQVAEMYLDDYLK